MARASARPLGVGERLLGGADGGVLMSDGAVTQGSILFNRLITLLQGEERQPCQLVAAGGNGGARR